MDDNLTRLEGRAASSASRYGRMAAVALGVVVVAVAGFVVYRRTHRPTLRDRLGDLSLGDLKAVAVRLREAAPSVTLRVNEKSEEEPGTVEAIVRKLAPALAGTAGSALLQRFVSQPDEYSAPQAE